MMPTRDRREDFASLCQIISEHLVLQHQIRNHNWGPVSLPADPISETIGAVVTGKRGYGQVGQAPGNRAEDERPPGDYTDGSECKRQYRIYPNLDFRLAGVITEFNKQTFIRLELDLIEQNTIDQISPMQKGIHHQIQSNVSSIQVLREEGGQYFATDNMGLTKGKPFHIVTEDGIRKWDKTLGESLPGQDQTYGDYSKVIEWKDYFTSVYLQQLCRDNLSAEARRGFSNESVLELLSRLKKNGINLMPEPGTYIKINSDRVVDYAREEVFHFLYRQERGHFNLSSKNRDELRLMLKGDIIFVSHHYDRLGRICFSVLAFQDLSPQQIDIIIDEQFEGRGQDEKLQPNWYLFDDNVRDALYTDANSLGDRGAVLLAHAVQQNDRYEVTYWEPNNPGQLSDSAVKEILIGLDASLDEVQAQPDDLLFNNYQTNDVERRELTLRFFREGIVDFYRNMRNYTEPYGMGANIGFDHLIEHIILLWFGLRGCRSGARGVDVYELDGSPSEIKSSVGIHAEDYMGTATTATKPFKLQDNITKMQSWRRLFVGRVVDFIEGAGGNFHLVIWASNQNSITQLHDNIHQYFSGSTVAKTRAGRSSVGYRDNLQYNLDDITKNRAISSAKEKRWIDFVRIVEFREFGNGNSPQVIPSIESPTPIPQVSVCQCKYCKKGIFYWLGKGRARKFSIKKKEIHNGHRY